MSPTSSPVNSASDVDVAVVGAGISGLVTATRLIEAGLTCAVLESRDRVGGRLLTHHSPAGRFDLGATWFFPGEPRVAALIEELGVPTHAQHLSGDAMYHVPGGAQRMDGNPIDVVSGRFSHGAASLAERLADRLGDAVSLRTPVREIDPEPASAIRGSEGGNVLFAVALGALVLALGALPFVLARRRVLR